MILIDADFPERRWQAVLLKKWAVVAARNVFVPHRSLPGLKWEIAFMNKFGTTATVGLVSVLVLIRLPTQLIVAATNSD